MHTNWKVAAFTFWRTTACGVGGLTSTVDLQAYQATVYTSTCSTQLSSVVAIVVNPAAAYRLVSTALRDAIP